MKNSMLRKLSNSWKGLHWCESEENEIDTLTLFVSDTEHELLSVLTALQAHIDLLRDAQVLNEMPVDRFTILDRAISRLTADATILASVAELAQAPRSKQKQMLAKLMQEIADETSMAFSNNKVSLSCDIAKGVTVPGNAGSLKKMITELVLSLLNKSHQQETIKIVGLKHNKQVSLSFDIGLDANQGEFMPWQLGKLRLIPTNGDGITLAAVAAMARLYRGRLSVSSLLEQRHGYRLTFRV